MRKFFILFAGVVFSQPLVQEIAQQLAKQPYAEVAPLIGKMQEEASHQPAPETPPPLPQAPALAPKPQTNK